MVVFGGRSGEHEVSLRSAVSILKEASRSTYRVTPVGIRKDGSWRAMTAAKAARVPADKLPKAVLQRGVPVALVPHAGGARLIALGGGVLCRPGAVFPVLHGTYGEDGTIQGLFEMCAVPYVGSGVTGSAVAMDKVLTKRILRDGGIPIVPFTVWARHLPLAPAVREAERTLGYPMFVKPVNLGSSVGIHKAKGRAALRAAMADAARYDRTVIVEKAVDAREIECAVLGNEAAAAATPGEIIPSNEFYDYADKYLKVGAGSAAIVIPAKIPAAVARRARELAVRAFHAVGCEGMARVDLFLERRTGSLYLNEANTIPGFTSISMYAKMWAAEGLSYPALIDRLVKLAIARHREVSRNMTTFEADC